MPSLRHILVDALAVTLVGVGLTAAVGGYLRNLPAPSTPPAPSMAGWDEPLTTGSIAPADAAANAPSAGTEAAKAEPWIDPPRRTARAARHRAS